MFSILLLDMWFSNSLLKNTSGIVFDAADYSFDIFMILLRDAQVPVVELSLGPEINSYSDPTNEVSSLEVRHKSKSSICSLSILSFSAIISNKKS